MLRVAQEAFLADHFTSNEIEELQNLITTNAYKAMQLKEPEIKPGNKSEFIILQTKTIYDAIRTALPPFLVIRGKHYAINEIKTRIDENEEGTPLAKMKMFDIACVNLILGPKVLDI
jgi:hypothetical protein